MRYLKLLLVVALIFCFSNDIEATWRKKKKRLGLVNVRVSLEFLQMYVSDNSTYHAQDNLTVDLSNEEKKFLDETLKNIVEQFKSTVKNREILEPEDLGVALYEGERLWTNPSWTYKNYPNLVVDKDRAKVICKKFNLDELTVIRVIYLNMGRSLNNPNHKHIQLAISYRTYNKKGKIKYAFSSTSARLGPLHPYKYFNLRDPNSSKVIRVITEESIEKADKWIRRNFYWKLPRFLLVWFG
jgi:hypothetical protein